MAQRTSSDGSNPQGTTPVLARSSGSSRVHSATRSSSTSAAAQSRPSRSRKSRPELSPSTFLEQTDKIRPNPNPSIPPRRWVGQVALAVVGLGLGISVGMAITVETHSQLVAPGGISIFISNVTGLVGTYLAMVMVLLVSRIPPVERVLGQDGLLRWHRRLGPWPISLLVAHAVFVTIGYAQTARSGIWQQIGSFMNTYADVLAATVGLGLMIMAGIASIGFIRRRVRRETWWIMHLYLYMALALSFAHVIALGPSFVGHPFTQAVWSLVWIATAGMVIAYRIGLPIIRSIRHNLKVVEVVQEAPGVVSVICMGRNLERLSVSGGQFFAWRFLTRKYWWQAHPYSISALPKPPYLRLTIKAVGDHSAAMANIRPGTRVAIEGPYGAFTRYSQHRSKVVLIAAGIGITALRSLLEDLPSRSAPTVIVRATNEEDLVFRSEIAELVRHRKGQLYERLGPRNKAILSAQTLRKLVPDILQRDLYVCGPEEFVSDIVTVAHRLGIPREAVHHEAFSY